MNLSQHAFWGQRRRKHYYITLSKLHLKYSVFSIGLVLCGFYFLTSETSIKTLRLTNFKSRNFYELQDRLEGFILNVGLRNEAYLPQHHESCLRISGTASFDLRSDKEK